MGRRIITAIDVGSSKIATVVAYLDDNEKRPVVIGVHTPPSRGIRKGSIVNIEEATDAIAESITAAEKMAGVRRPVKLSDIWTNCGLVVKQAQEKPLLPLKISERRRDYGRDILLHLPVGLSDLDFYRRLDKLYWAFNAEIELEPVNGKLLMRVMNQPLKNMIPYEDMEPPGKTRRR